MFDNVQGYSDELGAHGVMFGKTVRKSALSFTVVLI